MAQYRFINAEIRRVPQGKQNANKEYIVAQIKNIRSMYEPSQTFVCFLPEVVEALKPYIDIQHGGTAQQAQPIPAEYNVTGCWCDYTPATKFYKQHLSAHDAIMPSPQNPKGRAAINVGDLVKDNNGNPIVYTTLRVFCQYYIDEDGSRVYIRGCSPEEAGQQAFSAYCIAINENTTPQVAEPIEVVQYQEGQIPPQPQQAIQQPVQPQPTQPQFVQQQGASVLPY